MTDPWKTWTHGLYQKNMQERALVVKAYEKIFDQCMGYVNFVQRNTLQKFTYWDVPADSLVDRTVCRDYILRRIAKLGLAVSVPNPSAEPYRLLIDWIHPSLVPQTPYQDSTADMEDEEDVGPLDEKEDEDEEEEESPSRKRKKKKKEAPSSLMSFYRKLANPAKIIGE